VGSLSCHNLSGYGNFFKDIISFVALFWAKEWLKMVKNGPKKFLVKTEGLSSLPPAKSGRACYGNPTGRGHFYQMPNMYISYNTIKLKLTTRNILMYNKHT